jgi:branched-chain amino acid transport system ATP-binding protein
VLSARALSAGYGAIEVVHAAAMEIGAGECVALVGWAGSGKTTLMRTLVGLMPASAGEIVLEGRDITALPAHARVALGITMVPEGRRLFRGMSVHENILVGAHAGEPARLGERMAYVLELFPILNERRNQIAGTLSGGEQQMCAIARALMSEPRLLLIDELSLGLAPLVVARLVQVIEAIRQLGTTILLVEQDAELALSISDRAYIIRGGRIVRSGRSAEIKSDPAIVRDFFAPLETQ